MLLVSWPYILAQRLILQLYFISYSSMISISLKQVHNTQKWSTYQWVNLLSQYLSNQLSEYVFYPHKWDISLENLWCI